MKVCVFGAASPTIDEKYMKKAEQMGEFLAKRGHTLVFGAGANGMMGATARGFKNENAYILGVIPKFFENEYVEQICTFCDEIVFTETMRERKQIMEDNADAFIVLPGGIGTFEEFFEILTLKQLCRHKKPIVLYNMFDYYSELNSTMLSAIEKEFIKDNCKELYLLSDNLDEIVEYIETPMGDEYTLKDFKNG